VLADLDTVAVEVGLTEREIFLARQADTAFVESASQAGFAADGTIDGIAQRADPSTGTYLVRIRVDNSGEQAFLGGMVVDVHIPYANLEAVATVPAAAILMPDTDPHVFIVRDGQAVRVDLDIVARQDDRLGVTARGARVVPGATSSSTPNGNNSGASTAPLRTGDLVVIVGQTQLVDGAPVEVATQR